MRSNIVVREFAFDFPSDLDPDWIPASSVRAQLFNGWSLSMPYLEPFLVKTMREAGESIDDPDLQHDIRQFNGQEAAHYKCHRRLNEVLTANGHAEYTEVEDILTRSYAKLSQRSMRTRLAYSAGFECMTNGFTNWMINKRRKLFAQADPHITSFWVMHMIEEAEHKTVAYDTYMAYSGAYLPRALGVLHGSLHVLSFGYITLFKALQRRRTLTDLPTLGSVVTESASLIWNVGPYLLRALLPWHHPRGEEDPQWMQDWVRGHATLSEGATIPLIDTHCFDMPVPFEKQES